ncbi:condensation domain-containing protein [Streptomyces sp. NPDC001339]|uniref:condensation domain-containing protein n=1 Tax=Streptomyces sp. NPDC001339 TaxID=3364563 RepID=UPI0036A44A5F
MSSATPTARPADALGARSPATRKEEGLWLLEQLIPDESVNNVPGVALEIDGRLDHAVLRRAVQALVRRYETLRTVFHADGTGLTRQVLSPGQALAALEVEGGGAAPESVPAALDELVTRPFPLDGRPLLRVGHYAGPDGDAVGVAVHHLIFDGTSMSVFLEELAAAYDAELAGTAAAGETVPAWAEPVPRPESVQFWRDHLRGFDAGGLGLWCDGTESPRPTLRGSQLTRAFSEEAVAGVAALQKDLRAPDVVVLLAAYYLLLAAHGAGPDLAVGFPVNVRGQQAQRAIGYHVNIVPLRVRYDPAEGFRSFTRRVRDLFFEAIAHADAPVDVLLPEVDRADASWRTTLFRHIFNYLPLGGQAAVTLGGLPARVVEVDAGHSKFDLEFVVLPSAGGSRLKAVHNAELHSAGGVAALMRRYDTLLVAAAAQPDLPMGELPLWTEADRAVARAAERARPTSDAPGPLRAVLDRVRTTPQATALVDGAEVSYAQLWRAAQDSARLLAAVGAAPGDTVAVTAPRGAWWATAVLGGWLAGATVLPVDPELPLEQAVALTAEAGGVALLTAAVTGPQGSSPVPVVGIPPVPSAVDGGDPADGVRFPEPDAVAYLAPRTPQDRASTGRAALRHEVLGQSVAGVAATVGCGPEDAVLWLAPADSAACAHELLLALSRGARLVTGSDAAHGDARLLGELIAGHGVTVLHGTPSTWRTLLEPLGGHLAGRKVLCGGEPLPSTLARQLLSAGCAVFALWGTAQAGCWTAALEVVWQDCEGYRPPAGALVRDAAAGVVAPDGRELPVGVRGELRLDGVRTGVLAHWLEDGLLSVDGPLERQVTVNGTRIALDDVESRIADHPAVRAVAVTAQESTGGTVTLTAVVQAADKPDVERELARHARDRLPARARPDRFVLVSELPLTRWRTVDRAAVADLARPVPEPSGEAAEAAPGGDTAHLVALFARLLRRDGVSEDTNFFAHGGHSLLAAQLAQEIEKTTGARLKLSEVFENPTPAELAEQIRARQADPTRAQDTR